MTFVLFSPQKEAVEIVSDGEESDPDSVIDDDDDDAVIGESQAETKSRTKIKLVFKSKKGAKGKLIDRVILCC